MKRSLIGLAVVGLLFAGVAGAAVRQGNVDLDALGSYMTLNGADEGGDLTAWFLSAGLGYFLTDNIRVGAAGLYANIDDETGITDQVTKLWGIGANVKYHFMPANQLVPYIGAQIFWTSIDVDPQEPDEIGGSTDGLLWGPLAGVRFELNSTNDLFVEYQYLLFSGDISDDLFDSGHAIFAGIAHRFK